MIYCLNPNCLKPNPDNFKYCHKCGTKLLLTERYILRSILGQGGFGRTFLATDQNQPSQPYYGENSWGYISHGFAKK
ncbi:4-Cys prefix domain-containing protein [Nodularia spumigena]|uniref:4-Cys prefix domain-containing protein n=1 Tax=Nodularia spumigena TaxID=70799 RepID=UPI003A8DC530